jgi:RNA polymerase sigma-70 factor (ECF subfamily)
MNKAKQAEVSGLYHRFGPIIYSRCRRLLRDDALAEDATQEIFVRVMRHLDSAPEGAALTAWISRIATNHCLNLIRDRSRHAETVESVPDRGGDHPETERLDHLLALQLVRHAPDKLRSPAVLYYFDGLQHEHVARTLGISRRTVINRLNRFLGLSRKLIGGPSRRNCFARREDRSNGAHLQG